MEQAARKVPAARVTILTVHPRTMVAMASEAEPYTRIIRMTTDMADQAQAEMAVMATMAAAQVKAQAMSALVAGEAAADMWLHGPLLE